MFESAVASNSTPSSTLTAIRDAAAVRDEAEVEIVQRVADWAEGHAVVDPDEAASGDGREHLVPLAGEGCPMVAEFAIAELATALGMSDSATRSLIGDALDLRYRLPHTWARAEQLEIPVWRARTIAAGTRQLGTTAALWVDLIAAPIADKLGLRRLTDVVDRAIARFDPEEAHRRSIAAGERRKVTIGDMDRDGLSFVYGELDGPAAKALDHKLNEVASALGTLGDTRPHDVRRAYALGLLADPQGVLELLAGETTERPRQPFDLTLYAHLRGDDPTASVEQQLSQLIDTIMGWAADASRVKIAPVIDLAEQITCTGYLPSDRLREQTWLKDDRCVFPHCTRQSRRQDHDHCEPYDPDGPPGQTSSENQARLCRYHHRLKTHGRWRYQRLPDGAYIWLGPDGDTYYVA
jgi:Domain of unknown function (DUF222)